MFERFKRDEPGGGTAVADRPVADTRSTAERVSLRSVRARQREEFGGVNWGAAFFGWLVAIGLGALLVGLVAAMGAAVGLTDASGTDAAGNVTEIGVGGTIVLLAMLAIAYYGGGYVAGRMSRFDGARQGLGAWLIGLIVTVILAIAGALLGAEYNVLQRLELPALPVGDSKLASGGALALALIVAGTLVAAAAGGLAGERYHRRIDRVGFPD
jgi:hypothetical protein